LILEPRFKMTEKGHGGARPGAGRKPGAIRKATAAAQAKAAEGGILPLDFMLDRMRDTGAPIADRMDMAKAAAPFIHAKLASVEANFKGAMNHAHVIELIGVRPG
jgi:hypothetical protein